MHMNSYQLFLIFFFGQDLLLGFKESVFSKMHTYNHKFISAFIRQGEQEGRSS